MSMSIVEKVINSAKTKIIEKLSGLDKYRHCVSCRIEVGENPTANDNTFSDMIKFMKEGKKKKFGNKDLTDHWRNYTSKAEGVCTTLKSQASEYRKLCLERDRKMKSVNKGKYEEVLKNRKKFEEAVNPLMKEEDGRKEAIAKIEQKHKKAENELEELKTQISNAIQEQQKLDKNKEEYTRCLPENNEYESLSGLMAAVNVIGDIDIKGLEDIKRRIGELANTLRGQIESLSENFKTTINEFDLNDVFEIYFSNKRNFTETCGDLSRNDVEELNKLIAAADKELKKLKKQVGKANEAYKEKIKTDEKAQKKAAKEAARAAKKNLTAGK